VIIGDIYGGLGNQMFQYAFYRALSKEINAPIKFCTSLIDNKNSHNGFELLEVFDIDLEIASQKDIFDTVGFLPSFLIFRKFLRLMSSFGINHSSLIFEPHYSFWNDYHRFAVDDIFYSGYWQTQKYFENYSNLIRKDFVFSKPMDSKNLEIALSIKESTSISLHVRRGDYLSNRKTFTKHGICSLEYYENSINFFLSKFPQARFFTFSDDVNWVRNFLLPKFDSIEVVDINYGKYSYNDMRLMSLCNHHIISNSTFSWWGAWLNESINKKVIAPKKWFADGTDSSDLIPEDWLRL